jgi:hypothetical protein
MVSSAVEVRMKFERARHHIAQLEAEILDYFSRVPFESYGEDDLGTGDLVYRVRVHRAPPAHLSLPLGDAIHSARSALDYLARQLVIAGGGTPGVRTAFPIADDIAKFTRICRDSLQGAPPSAVTAVENLQPYRGGDDRFWRLHKLDVEDKHHLLIPVGAAHHSVNVSFGLPGMRSLVLGLLPADRMYPLESGAEIYRVKKAMRDTVPVGGGQAESFGFDVAFGEGTVVNGDPIFPTIIDLVDGIETAITPLFSHLT